MVFLSAFASTLFFFFPPEDGILDDQESRGFGNVSKRQAQGGVALAQRLQSGILMKLASVLVLITGIKFLLDAL